MTNDTEETSVQTEEGPFRAYANSAYFDTTLWDMTIIFGQPAVRKYDQPGILPTEWHTAMTMPWGQAKLIAYFIQANIAAHEILHGKVELLRGLVPPVPVEPDSAASSPEAVRIYEAVKKLHSDYFRE